MWRGWLVVGVVEKVVGGWHCGEGGWWLALGGWSKITIAKEKYYLKDHSPGDTNNSLSTSVGKSI